MILKIIVYVVVISYIWFAGVSFGVNTEGSCWEQWKKCWLWPRDFWRNGTIKRQ